MPLTDKNMEIVPHGIDAEPPVEPWARNPTIVLGKIIEAIPVEHQEKFQKILDSISKYQAPEQFQGWGEIASLVNSIVAVPPEKIKAEWQVEVVAILMNRTEEAIRKHFS